MEKQIKIYSTPTCHYCKVAKEYLKNKKIEFMEIDVKEDLEQRKKMVEISGQMGVPVITIDNKVMTGWNEDIFEEMIS